jgi:hypothetical protein
VAALKQEQVDDFISKSKRVALPREIAWRSPGGDWLTWAASIEIDAVFRGRLWLDFNKSVPGSYKFQIYLHNKPVLGWHFRPVGRHRNRRGCPPEYNGNIGYPHEQKWIEGIGFECARFLDYLDGLTHEQQLRKFCDRVHLELLPAYRPPEPGEQTVMHFEEEE